MIKKIFNNRKNIEINMAIIFSFFCVSIFCVYFLLKANIINGAWDLPFHWGRIYELVKSFRNHVFLPHFNINSMGGNGTSVMLLYPYFTLLPFVVILLFVKFSISLFYIFFAIIYFEGLLISFYSSKTLSLNSVTSYVFSILYCTSSIFMTFSFTNMDLGALLSFIYMPLVIFGFSEFIKNDKWIELTIGVTLIIFSHVLSSILVFLFIFVWFLVDFKQIWKNKIKMINLGKAILSVTLLTSFIWIPAIVFLLTNDIKKPINFGMPSSLDLLSLLYTSMTNNIMMSWGLSVFATIGFIFAPIIFYHKFTPTIKKLYWLSFAFAIFSTGLFPWEQSLSHTPLSIIQFPWRLDTVPQLLFTYIFATCLTQYLNSKSRPPYIILVLIVTLTCQLSAQKQVISLANRHTSYNLLHPLFKNDDYYKPYNAKNNQPYLNYHISNANEINYVIKSQFPVNDYPDYYPKQSFIERENLSKDVGVYGVKTIKLKLLGNGEFRIAEHHLHDIRNFEMPFVYYNFVHYQVYEDHHPVNFHCSSTHLLTLNKLSREVKNIKIHIVPSKLSYVYNMIAIIGILYFAIEIYKEKRKRA
ncbi:YfhO family protein [Lentilactobacillus parakefiri]|uniref:Membrane protein 6-pyruvoyl-tetrahydropterin synthase-related domain-containing protein n=1 Tax=Lentilactobacillus parakefiri TaxID=152332 RepID=A0A224V7Q8_9LACO|nr:YfhO family protein [Lentilactobacillus parakefiri]TDG92704.1 hypothetical protein C5L28_001181 [Lentilactobacillus parakefiri]GAW73177.1 hypothetical protein LPKJCM_02319 [Lentilactobacillus parakefiri]